MIRLRCGRFVAERIDANCEYRRAHPSALDPVKILLLLFVVSVDRFISFFLRKEPAWKSLKE